MNRFFRKIKKAFHQGINRLIQPQGQAVLKKTEVDPDTALLCRQTAEEGMVLLKNNHLLPIRKNQTVSVFGRVQINTFFCGYGSGGDVKSPYKINFLDALKKQKQFGLNQELTGLYTNWCQKNGPDDGYWGHWPRFYEEMPLSIEEIKQASAKSDIAIQIIGRSSGEDRENTLEKGSYYLTNEELSLLRKITSQFVQVVLVFNIGSIVDLSFLAEFGDKIGAILIAWQGGMESGNALVEILSGETSPAGKLVDTIPTEYAAYPTINDFGDAKYNNYVEDIYVGYRYFQTFANDKILYPFGYGLSYASFSFSVDAFSTTKEKIRVTVKVRNTGEVYQGKEVIQLYASAPQGKLGNPVRSLIAFQKTVLLASGQEELLSFEMTPQMLASFDDTGKSGYPHSYVLEEGVYEIWAGNNAQNLILAGSFRQEKTECIEQLEAVMPLDPAQGFMRLIPQDQSGTFVQAFETNPTRIGTRKERILSQIPKGIPVTEDKGYLLEDVQNGKISLDAFIAQLSDQELEELTIGYGPMNCPSGVPGNAGGFGGFSDSLKKKGIPLITTTDGPSGIRSAYQASLVPIGTMLACTWNPELVESLYRKVGQEMEQIGTNVLLGPGMNLHRSPLCGRNFEYFSEDPLVSGKIAAAVVRGIQKNGRSACPKHFACNNQEFKRDVHDSRVSERALREIYLKGFEICVKEAHPKLIMTSYNKINGVWSHYNDELVTTILREEWGFAGTVLTDWWMQPCVDPDFPLIANNAYRIRAQVDVLMPGGKAWNNPEIDRSLLLSIDKDNGITRGEIQRSVKNVLRFMLDSPHTKNDSSME